jgi:FkbM family methyltransferase
MEKSTRELLQQDLLRKIGELDGGLCNLDDVGLLDLVLGYRLFFGRWPSGADMEHFQAAPARPLDQLTAQFLSSSEFQSRKLAVEFERPAHDCLVMTETPEGLRFFFSLRDTFVGLPIAVGVFERDVDAVFRRLLRPGMNCLDIGANLGYYSVRMAAVVSQGGGRVFSFEPDPLAFYLLTKNRQENHLENVVSVFQVACGDRDSAGVLVRDLNPANYGGGHVRDAATQNGSPTAIRRVDDLVPEDVRVDFVKIDIEGYEPLALRGMERILTRDRPAIVMEFNPPALRSNGTDAPERLLQDLASRGYVCYEALSFAGGNAAPFQFPATSGDSLVNLVCAPSSKSG